LPVNLLTDRRTPAEFAAWLTAGDTQLPAFGAVLSPAQIEAVVAFIDGVRTGRLPRPDEIFALSPDAPKHYTLLPGVLKRFEVRAGGGRASRGGCWEPSR